MAEREEKREEEEKRKTKPREKPSPSRSDRFLTSSSDSGTNKNKRKKASGQLPQQPESDTRRKKLNQLKEQFAQLKSKRKSIDTGPTDEDVKTVPVKPEEKPLVEETALADFKKETEELRREEKGGKTTEPTQTERTARTWNNKTNHEESNKALASDAARRHILAQTPPQRDENSFKRFFRIISSTTSSKKKKKEDKMTEPNETPVIRSLPIAAPQYEDDYGVQHKFDGYTTREGNTDAVQTLKAQMESKNQSRARLVRILGWTMKIAVIVAIILSILGWISVYLLTLRISNNSFDIVRVEQSCAANPIAHLPESTSKKSTDNCRKAGVPISGVELTKGEKGRYRKLTPGVLYRKEAGDSVFMKL